MTHSAETQCLSGERRRPHRGSEQRRKSPISILVIACCHRGADCNCPSEKLQLCSGKGDQNHRQGVPVPPPAWLPGGRGQAPSRGPGACAHPARGHTRAGPAQGHPGAGRPENQGPLPLYGEFLQEKSQQPILYFPTPDPVYILRCS